MVQHMVPLSHIIYVSNSRGAVSATGSYLEWQLHWMTVTLYGGSCPDHVGAPVGAPRDEARGGERAGEVDAGREDIAADSDLEERGGQTLGCR